MSSRSNISVIYHSYSCSDDTDQPVYEVPPPKYSADYILKILLDPDIDKRKICTSKPTNVTRSATYVVNIQSLKHADDIKKDQFGIWNYSGSHPQAHQVSCGDEGHISVEICGNGATGQNVVYLRRLHCTHPSNHDFKRLICFITGKLSSSLTCQICSSFLVVFLIKLYACVLMRSKVTYHRKLNFANSSRIGLFHSQQKDTECTTIIDNNLVKPMPKGKRARNKFNNSTQCIGDKIVLTSLGFGLIFSNTQHSAVCN